jgi:iron complex transport system substrate-binding protein
METAIERGGDADYWFDLAFFPKKSAGEMIGADPRLNAIQALKQGRSFHRMGRGNDYFLTGTIDVDVVLADIVSILHPTVLPNHSLVFLKRTPAE